MLGALFINPKSRGADGPIESPVKLGPVSVAPPPGPVSLAVFLSSLPP